MVRTGEARARISGVFDVPNDVTFRSLLDEAGIELEQDEILIEREILANGKSRAFVSNRPATATLLKSLSPWLGDIHGQNEQQQLYDPVAQRDILDSFAGAAEQRKRVAELYRAWNECGRELAQIDEREQERRRLADLWTFQRKEIEAVQPKAGEDLELENERRVLQNITRLAEHAEAAYTALYDAPDSAAAQARMALRRVEEVARIDGSLREVADLIAPAVIAIEEAGRTLRDYFTNLEADPARLETVESRLAALDKLKRKYGPELSDVFAFLDEVRQKMRMAESAEEMRAEIEQRRQRLAALYAEAAGDLSRVRAAAARAFEGAVEHELAALAMPGAVFRVRMETLPWSETGHDGITFLVSANRGEEPRELARVASGGEVSRIALAIKTCVERNHPEETNHLLVFDEVDAGIGGDAAEAVGRRLKELSRNYQVLCVTHQATIASFADHHFRVEKREVNSRTAAAVSLLSEEDRTREIGRMLSGQRLTPEALRHAEQLLIAGRSQG
jgi:DNA repair protein RecN (Recombination protein N)